MIVLVEAYHYAADDLAELIDERYITVLSTGRVKLNYVGYLVDNHHPNSLLILPKVFLSYQNGQAKLLGDYSPEDLLAASDNDAPIRQQLQSDRLPDGQSKLDFLFRFSVWLYRAIRQFRQRKSDSVLTEQTGLMDVSDAGNTALSELELVLALVRFHQDNHNLLIHIKRLSTSQKHTISWSKTVTRQQPIIQNGQLIYNKPVVKQKQINYDEELIILYLTTLDDLRREYGFRLELNSLYTLLPIRERVRFRTRATRRLKEIRANYFSDKLLRVWNLLYLYYDRQDKLRTGKNYREILLVRDFNIVFEDMIDSLLSDPTETLPPSLREQPDGKIVDHIYAYQDLIQPDTDQIYHIGDSKYYKTEANIGETSVAKQFTYARNVIQQNIDLLNINQLHEPLRYRDKLTEGYNLTPNFFISATVDSLNFWSDNLTFRQEFNHNFHFPGRLFDRDTLLLQAYDINFLFVLNGYITRDHRSREEFRSRTRRKFRQRLVDYIDTQYKIYKLTFANTDLMTEFVNQQFRALTGRMYRPSDFENSLLIAIPNIDTEITKSVQWSELAQLANVEIFVLKH